MLIQGTAQPGAQRGAWAAAAAPARSAGRHWAAPVWVPAERGRQRQRRGGRAHRGSWAHRGAGMPPARRARAADRPCVYPVRRSWTHGNPRAAAALCACGRDVAKGGGSGQTWRSAHRRQGRAADGGRSLVGRSSCLNAREAGWVAPAAAARAATRLLYVRKAGADVSASQLAAACERAASQAIPLSALAACPALLSGRAGDLVRCTHGDPGAGGTHAGALGGSTSAAARAPPCGAAKLAHTCEPEWPRAAAWWGALACSVMESLNFTGITEFHHAGLRRPPDNLQGSRARGAL